MGENICKKKYLLKDYYIKYTINFFLILTRGHTHRLQREDKGRKEGGGEEH